MPFLRRQRVRRHRRARRILTLGAVAATIAAYRNRKLSQNDRG